MYNVKTFIRQGFGFFAGHGAASHLIGAEFKLSYLVGFGASILTAYLGFCLDHRKDPTNLESFAAFRQIHVIHAPLFLVGLHTLANLLHTGVWSDEMSYDNALIVASNVLAATAVAVDQEVNNDRVEDRRAQIRHAGSVF